MRIARAIDKHPDGRAVVDAAAVRDAAFIHAANPAAALIRAVNPVAAVLPLACVSPAIGPLLPNAGDVESCASNDSAWTRQAAIAAEVGGARNDQETQDRPRHSVASLVRSSYGMERGQRQAQSQRSRSA